MGITYKIFYAQIINKKEIDYNIILIYIYILFNRCCMGKIIIERLFQKLLQSN
jgi:predicted acetyltransferase